MWYTKKTSLTSSESAHLWRHMTRVPVKPFQCHTTDSFEAEDKESDDYETGQLLVWNHSNNTSLVFNLESKEGCFSDTAFACIHNPGNASNWALIRLDNLHFADDTACMHLFSSKKEVLKFITNRYFHRMLYPHNASFFAVE